MMFIISEQRLEVLELAFSVKGMWSLLRVC